MPASARAGTGTRDVLYVSRLEPRKGIDDLLRAVPLVIAAEPAARFTIVGAQLGSLPGGATYENLFASSVPAEVADRVRFLGWVADDEVDRIYASADVFVLPSRYESFGLAPLEAMARGLPVVTTRIGGIREVVTDDVAVLVPPGDHEALAAALIDLLGDATKRSRLAAAGRAHVEERFSAELMTERTIALYQELTGQRC
jgi:glycogen synthase